MDYYTPAPDSPDDNCGVDEPNSYANGSLHGEDSLDQELTSYEITPADNRLPGAEATETRSKTLIITTQLVRVLLVVWHV